MFLILDCFYKEYVFFRDGRKDSVNRILPIKVNLKR